MGGRSSSGVIVCESAYQPNVILLSPLHHPPISISISISFLLPEEKTRRANPRASRHRLQRERRKPYSYATLPQDVSHGRGHSCHQRMYNPFIVTVTNFREDGPSSRSLIAYYFLSSFFVSVSFAVTLFDSARVYTRRERKTEEELEETLQICSTTRTWPAAKFPASSTQFASSAPAGPRSTSFRIIIKDYWVISTPSTLPGKSFLFRSLRAFQMRPCPSFFFLFFFFFFYIVRCL